jgi:hypothetical protein
MTLNRYRRVPPDSKRQAANSLDAGSVKVS